MAQRLMETSERFIKSMKSFTVASRKSGLVSLRKHRRPSKDGDEPDHSLVSAKLMLIFTARLSLDKQKLFTGLSDKRAAESIRMLQSIYSASLRLLSSTFFTRIKSPDTASFEDISTRLDDSVSEYNALYESFNELYVELSQLSTPALCEEVDWRVRDVLVGSLGSVEQFRINLEKRFYYVPSRVFDAKSANVRFVTLYRSHSMFGEACGISHYGEVVSITKVKRRRIPVPIHASSPNDDYYLFKIREWKTLPSMIRIKDEGVYAPRLTSFFLLMNCTDSYELFSVTSREQYELLRTLKDILRESCTDDADGTYIDTQKHELECGASLRVRSGELEIHGADGYELFVPPLKPSDLIDKPAHFFDLIKKRLDI